ncbi:hypothetical protein [Paraburkholderia bannensis]|nr:hypothetical protein [Paraburkholderia bannensis]
MTHYDFNIETPGTADTFAKLAAKGKLDASRMTFAMTAVHPNILSTEASQ